MSSYKVPGVSASSLLSTHRLDARVERISCPNAMIVSRLILIQVVPCMTVVYSTLSVFSTCVVLRCIVLVWELVVIALSREQTRAVAADKD